MDLKGRSRLATSSVAGAQEGADRADRAERADRTREATFSGRLLEEETLHFEELGLDERVTVRRLKSQVCIDATDLQHRISMLCQRLTKSTLDILLS